MQVRVVPAKYVMKCDDDTFVRIDSVLDQVKKVRNDKSVYVGSINYFHRPLRSGKWAVTYEVNCCLLCNCDRIFVMQYRAHIFSSAGKQTSSVSTNCTFSLFIFLYDDHLDNKYVSLAQNS